MCSINPGEKFEYFTPYERSMIEFIYSYDPYILGLHPERKLTKLTYARFLKRNASEEIIKRVDVRKKNEYFLYVHVGHNYNELCFSYVTETLWRAKQFQFRAASKDDFGKFDIFKEKMNIYIQEREGILPDEELEEIREFVDKADPEEFKIFDPKEQKMVPYDEKVLRRLLIHIRDKCFIPHFGTQQIGVFCDRFNGSHSWYCRILCGIE
ncbi:hypothetical protein TVAG_276350 [Trichomonas vaginalis G3]|uniref:Uncharacterized protein n=1 Tax=Trichomonas vaginalis (strain ATCC PRA-98 / G3) TaxID=412133 RepID=A2ECR6_TRIV3|nr:hypothetical protein TVAGG3_0379840 [Trichomonas vaginalis G3]EAY09562.1 hypothetical protein TVAG_276350 [Trichomonas vaginalis G3]KAI5533191.1 hypothetical protein TVAGG3_0379840 [Trichomonas vaginalis G3]|eukprot:XP_001321785.1 hypothetical protein [Trichomonas vaginalis G3]